MKKLIIRSLLFAITAASIAFIIVYLFVSTQRYHCIQCYSCPVESGLWAALMVFFIALGVLPVFNSFRNLNGWEQSKYVTFEEYLKSKG